jgi:hypothetical protein
MTVLIAAVTSLLPISVSIHAVRKLISWALLQLRLGFLNLRATRTSGRAPYGWLREVRE